LLRGSKKRLVATLFRKEIEGTEGSGSESPPEKCSVPRRGAESNNVAEVGRTGPHQSGGGVGRGGLRGQQQRL